MLHAKQYVARRIEQPIRMGKAKKLDRAAVHWCRNEHRPATRRALAIGRIRLEDLGGRCARFGRTGARDVDTHLETANVGVIIDSNTQLLLGFVIEINNPPHG